jgi:D-glycero-beta-D-manno-heptose-7-phosphate kinase
VHSLKRKIRAVKVLVVGDLVADHYLYGETERISREAPVLVVRYEREQVLLGGAGNVMANAAALGARVTAVSAVGKDSNGKQLLNLLERAGVHAHCLVSTRVQTESKMRVLAGGLSTKRQQMLRVDRGNAVPLPDNVNKALARKLTVLGGEHDIVLVSDYGGGVLSADCIEALHNVKAKGVPVVVDSRYQLQQFFGLTALKPNEPELMALAAAAQVPVEREFIKLAAAVRQRANVEVLLVTRGRQGLLVAQSGRCDAFPHAGKAEAVDVTGAGDTVLSAFGVCWAATGDLLRAAQLSNLAGALQVQKPGTATVAADELFEAAAKELI